MLDALLPNVIAFLCGFAGGLIYERIESGRFKLTDSQRAARDRVREKAKGSL